MTFTGKIANWSARRRWWVISAAVLVIAMSMTFPGQLETKMYEGDGGEGDSGIAGELIDERFNAKSQATEQLVFNHETLDVDSQAYEAVVQSLAAELRALPEVDAVVTYYDTNSDEMVADDRGVSVAQVVIAGEPDDAEEKIDAILDTVHEAAASAENQGLEVTMAGLTSILKQSDEVAESDLLRVTLVTLVLGMFILLIAFRTVVAAFIPLFISVGAIITATALAAVVSQVYPLVEFYTMMVSLMGLAVGIDYSLFIISRFRSERKAGRPRYEAIAVASNTTGRAVLYAGITVLLSMFGLFMTTNPIFIGLSVGAIVVVAVAIVASLTLLPALLGALGDNINRLRVPIIGRESDESGAGGIWGAITDKVLARPAIMATITVTALVAAAIPVTTINLNTNASADSLSDAVEGKHALLLLEEHFTSGLTSPAYVVVDANDVNSTGVQAAVATLLATMEQDEAFFGPFETRINEAGDLLYVQLALAGNVDDAVSEDAVNHLRDDVVPAAFSGTSANVYVTGATAGNMDFNDHMASAAVYVFAFVLGLAFLLLLVIFRSIVIPLKAILLNLLSVGAAYGVVVMVFQYGWGIGLLGAEATGV